MDEGAYFFDHRVADVVDEALHQAVVQRAHDLGVDLGERTERAVPEADDGVIVVGTLGDEGIETEPVELGDQGFQAPTSACSRTKRSCQLSSSEFASFCSASANAARRKNCSDSSFFMSSLWRCSASSFTPSSVVFSFNCLACSSVRCFSSSKARYSF